MQPVEQSHSTAELTALPTLAQFYFDELTARVRGEVYRRGDNQCVYLSSCHRLVPVLLIPSVLVQVSRAHTPVQWKCSERVKGCRTSP